MSRQILDAAHALATAGRSLCAHREVGAVRIRPADTDWELMRGFEMVLMVLRRHSGRAQREPESIATKFAIIAPARDYGFRARGLRPRPGMTEGKDMPDIVCISPVDGREVGTARGVVAAEIEAAVAGGAESAGRVETRGVAERGKFSPRRRRHAGDARGDRPELAWQMGRPIRYGVR